MLLLRRLLFGFLLLIGLPALAATSNARTTARLATLGRVWGLLKYYHPGLAPGRLNWDSVLVATIPRVQTAADRAAWETALTSLVQAAGPGPAAAGNWPVPAWLSTDQNLPAALRQQLTALVRAYQPRDNAYVTKKYKQYTLSQPLFLGEKEYPTPAYPAEAYRLLGLFRYWNVIEYYYPFKAGTARDWQRVLPAYIPAFAGAADTLAYHQLCRRLSAELRDSHAGAGSKVIQRQQGGGTVPFTATFTHGQMVVERLRADSLAQACNVRPGDVITHLDGQPVRQARAARRPYFSASTPGALERDISSNLLLGPVGSRLRLTLRRGRETVQTSVPRFAWNDLKTKGRYGNRVAKPAWELKPGGVAYVRPLLLPLKDVDSLMHRLHQAPAIVFDIRSYPDWRMGAALARHLLPAGARTEASDEVDPQRPGQLMPAPADTARPAPRAAQPYRGRVFILADENTQSAAEGLVMTLQAYPGAVTVGSPTAGANGNVTSVNLPGDVDMVFSGVVIKYPDGTPTQRRGVRIDVPVRPTAAGLAAGRDEVLEKALELARQPIKPMAGR
jgi:C-terminal processing protease CtpA/Prc